MAELQGVIDAIHAGKFSPDCQRSEFFKEGQNVVVVSEQDQQVPSTDHGSLDSWSQVGQDEQPEGAQAHGEPVPKSKTAAGEEEVGSDDASSDSSSLSDSQS